MSVLPLHVVIADAEWVGHLQNAGVWANYMKYGFVPGAYYHLDNDTIYSKRSCWEAAKNGISWAVKLYCHEMGHKLNIPLNIHPTTIILGFRHAISVGFDTRSFTRVLRFGSGPEESKVAGVLFINTQRAAEDLS